MGPRMVMAKVATTAIHPASRLDGFAPTTASASPTRTQTAGMVATVWPRTSAKPMVSPVASATHPMTEPATIMPTAVERNAITAWEARWAARVVAPPSRGSARNSSSSA